LQYGFVIVEHGDDVTPGAHVKQNAETNLKVSVACQAGLAVDFIVGLAATHLPACLGGGSKNSKPSVYIIGGTLA